MARHPINVTRTSDEIAIETIAKGLTGCLADGVDAGATAKKLIDDLRGQQFSVVPIQQGQLTQLLDSLRTALANNDKLEKKVDGFADLQAQIDAIWQNVVKK